MTDHDASTAWVIGAGSGVGRATALDLMTSARVAISGRRRNALDETAALADREGGSIATVVADVADRASLARAHEAVVAALGPVDTLVVAAGLNVPQRHWESQSLEEFDAVLATNLTGVVSAIDLVLPSMRARGGGVIVVISSYSAWRVTPLAGVAYSASKSALRSIVATLNAEEARHGVRATHLCPGDIDTEFLNARPEVPDASRRATMLSADDVASAVRYVVDRPPHIVVDELVLSPTSQHR